MSSVDDRIVNMQFNNQQFKKGAADSEKALQSLESSIAKTGQSKGMAGLGASVDQVSGRFSALKIAGISAIATVASKATSMGLNFLKSFTIDPIIQGFGEYQTNLDSIQTVVANTGKSVPQVTKALQQLNHYSDLTIYNFSQMAKNVGTFTAAGVDLKTSVASIQGIANIAALSGSSAQQAATAMYQLSQAIAAGKVGLQDWNSVVNAGMGGKKLQTALSQTAVAMGVIGKSQVKLVGPMKQLTVAGESFRQSIQAKPGHNTWLSSDVLVNTLAAMDGRFSKTYYASQRTKDGLAKYTTQAQITAKIDQARNDLAKKGVKYTNDQFKAIKKMAEASVQAATQVKSLPQLIGVVQESMGSIWSNFFSGVLGNFTQSKNLWTGVGNIIQGQTQKLNNSVAVMLANWAKLGGRTNLIKAFGNIFGGLGKIVGAFKHAFQDVFPPGLGSGLADLTNKFKSFSTIFQFSSTTINNLRETFGGLFAVLHIGFAIVKGVFGAFSNFFGAIIANSGGASGGILKFTASIGTALKGFDKFLTQGGHLTNTIANIGTVAAKVVGPILKIAGAIVSLAGSLAMKGESIGQNIVGGILKGLNPAVIFAAVVNFATGIVDQFKSALGIHSPATELIPVGVNIVAGIAVGIGQGIGLIITAIGNTIKALFGGMSSLDVAAFFNAILTGATLLALRGFLKSMRSISDGFGGMMGSISGVLSQTTDTLKTMADSVKYKALTQIAIAVGILTAALVALALINPKGLAQGLAAISLMIGELVGAMAALVKVDAGGKIALVGAAMVQMALAIDLMTAAVAALAAIPLKNLEKGLAALTFMLTILVGAMAGLSALNGETIVSAGAMIAMAVAIDILVVAVAALGALPVKVLVKGIAALAFILTLLTASMVVLGDAAPLGAVAALGMIAIAAAIDLLVPAIVAFGLLPVKNLAKGGIMIAALLTLLTASLVAIGSVGPSAAIGAAGMIAIALALTMLVPVLLALSVIPWGTFLKGFAMLILLAVPLAAIGAVATAMATGFLALGAAMFLAGAGMALFGTGFAVLTAAGTAGIAILTGAITAFIALLPNIAIQMAAAFVAFIQVIGNAAGKIAKAIAKLVGAILDALGDIVPHMRDLGIKIIDALLSIILASLPKIGQVFTKLIETGLAAIRATVPDIVATGWFILNHLLTSIDNNIGKVANKGGDIVVKLINGITDNLVKITTAAAKAVLKFINGITAAINTYAPQFRSAGLKLIGAIMNAATGGLSGAVSHFASNLGSQIKSQVSGVLNGISFGLLGRQIAGASKSGGLLGSAFGAAFANSVKTAVAGAVQLLGQIQNPGGDATQTKLINTRNSQQSIADAAQAHANDLKKLQAAENKIAKDLEDKAKKTKDKKEKQRLLDEAKKHRNLASNAQNAADKAQKQADAAQTAVDNRQTFLEADVAGKGDIQQAKAQEAADKARQLLAKSQQEIRDANKIKKSNPKAYQALIAQAKKDAAAAKAAADNAEKLRQSALGYYSTSVGSQLDELAQQNQSNNDALAFETMTSEQKIAYLNQQLQKANDAKAAADQKYIDAIAAVKTATAKGDIATANAQLAIAQQALQDSQQASQDAKNYADQAQQLATDIQNGGSPSDTGGGSSDTGSGGGPSDGPASNFITPSNSILGSAASAVDKYTTSMQAAAAAAQAGAATIQYNQYNSSPEALSPTEVYRNTKNLLTATEVKMGSN